MDTKGHCFPKSIIIHHIEIRQCKYLNNIVEQGLGFKEFESARRTIAGIEIVHMLKKKQFNWTGLYNVKQKWI